MMEEQEPAVAGCVATAATVLELLAEDVPSARLDALVHDARHGDATPEQLRELERAVELARGMQGASARQRRRESALAALVDTARDLTSPYDLDTLLRVITRRTRRLLNFDMTYLALRRPDDDGSRVRTSEGGTTALMVGLDVPEGRCVGGLAQIKQAPVWTADYLADPEVPHASAIDEVIRAEGLHAVLAVPLRHGGESLGALYGASRNVRRFLPDEVATMVSLADLAAIAIEKASLLEQTRTEVAELEHDSSHTRTTLTRVRHLWDAHEQLIGLVLGGAQPEAVAGAAGIALDGALLVRDPAGRQLAASGALPALDEEAIARAAAEAHADGRPVELPGRIWVAPVAAGAEDLGVLVLGAAAPLTDEDVRLLQLAAHAFAALLLIQRSTAAAEGPVRDELLLDLLSDEGRGDPRLAERARRLGIDLDVPHVVVAARPEGGELGRAMAWASSYAYRVSGLKAVLRGCLVLLVPGAGATQAAQAVSRELSQVLGQPVTAGGAGPVQGPRSVAGAYEEAMRCLDALSRLRGTGAAASLEELGFLGLLLSADQDVDRFIHTTIGAVLDWDQEKSTDLVGTLEAYFASNGSPTHAAGALHVHPNTVARRIERIAELLGEGWQSASQALEIQLALRLLRTRGLLQRAAARA